MEQQTVQPFNLFAFYHKLELVRVNANSSQTMEAQFLHDNYAQQIIFYQQQYVKSFDLLSLNSYLWSQNVDIWQQGYATIENNVSFWILSSVAHSCLEG